MQAQNLIPESDLMTWTGYRHRDALVNWLRQHQVPYWLGNKGCICVTSDAVNAALLKASSIPTAADEIEF